MTHSNISPRFSKPQAAPHDFDADALDPEGIYADAIRRWPTLSNTVERLKQQLDHRQKDMDQASQLVDELISKAGISRSQARRSIIPLFHAVIEADRARQERFKASSRIDYEAYLQTSAWRKRRQQALRHAHYRCQVCNDPKTLHVHHRTYERLGGEDPTDLIVLCAPCHVIFHTSGKLA